MDKFLEKLKKKQDLSFEETVNKAKALLSALR